MTQEKTTGRDPGIGRLARPFCVNGFDRSFPRQPHTPKISRYPLLLSTIFHMILLISFTKWNATISAGVMEGFLCISCGVMTALNEDRFRAVARNIPAFVVLLLAAMLMLPTFADLNEWKTAFTRS
jgi:hypothetical protein